MKTPLLLIVLLTASLTPFSVCVAGAPMLHADLSTAHPVIGLGEPINLVLTLRNDSDDVLITSICALWPDRIWPRLQVVHIESGHETHLAVDRPVLTPLPASSWREVDGERILVSPAFVLPAGEAVQLTLQNVQMYVPLVAQGSYQLRIELLIPAFSVTLPRRVGEDVSYVADAEATWVTALSASIPVTVTWGASVTEDDAEWFTRARAALLRSRQVEDALVAFDLPEGRAVSPDVMACQQYWIGQTYEVFWRFSEACQAYEIVTRNHPDSVFADYAEARLVELKRMID